MFDGAQSESEAGEKMREIKGKRQKLPAARRQSIVIHSSLLVVKKLAAPLLLLLIQILAASNQKAGLLAVSVQRLQVPDLVVVNSMGARARPDSRTPFGSAAASLSQRQPEAASLTTGEPVAAVVFECVISYERRRDKNLIVKWHHDERNEPIYQWIPELNKRTIAPQYRPFIVPLNQTSGTMNGPFPPPDNANRTTIEASFRLVRPSKELAGKYTCSAISSQNDDSKSKKMIVYTPPRSFTFNSTRANLAALFASQRDRLIQLTQPAAGSGGAPNSALSNLPAAYRTRGLEQPAQQQAQMLPPTTISPQMLSTIDYVNVNRARQAGGAGAALRPRAGLKLVCDIDQVFPVPEVSIFRLAGRLPGAEQAASHADKLAKLETRIERDPLTGLFHVQVISLLDDDELFTIRQNQLLMQQMATSGGEPPPARSNQLEPEIHFECLIALTNLELSRYADNRRTLAYRPVGHSANSALVQGAARLNERQSSRAPTLHTCHSLLLTIATLLALLLQQRQLLDLQRA